jgi:hypothetical protein
MAYNNFTLDCQCVAEMFAAQTYNQSQAQNIPTIYGCVTSGRLWQYLIKHCVRTGALKISIDPTCLNFPTI